MLAVMKTLANLDVKDRRNKQSGKFGAKFQNKHYLCSMVSQGVATGERVILSRMAFLTGAMVSAQLVPPKVVEVVDKERSRRLLRFSSPVARSKKQSLSACSLVSTGPHVAPHAVS